MVINMTAGQRIRKMRKAYNITQADLADALGVTRQMVSKIEKCGDNMRVSTIKKIADVLHVDAHELID